MTKDDEKPVIVHEEKHAKLPLFFGYKNGKDEVPARDFIDRVEAISASKGKGDANSCTEFFLALRGDALKWCKSLKNLGIAKDNWPGLKARFLRDYEFKIPGTVVYKLESLKQKPGESVMDFYSRVDEQIELFFEGFEAATNQQAINCRMYFQKGMFIGGLREEIKTKVMETTLGTMAEVRDKAMQTEFIAQHGNTKTAEATPVFSMEMLDQEIDSFQEKDEPEEEDDMQEDEIALLNRFRKRMNRRPMRRGGRRGSFGGAPFTGKCYNCGMTGHRASNCRQQKRNDKTGIRAVEDDQEEEAGVSPIKNW